MPPPPSNLGPNSLALPFQSASHPAPPTSSLSLSLSLSLARARSLYQTLFLFFCTEILVACLSASLVRPPIHCQPFVPPPFRWRHFKFTVAAIGGNIGKRGTKAENGEPNCRRNKRPFSFSPKTQHRLQTLMATFQQHSVFSGSTTLAASARGGREGARTARASQPLSN